jgi:hypothetical protein
MVTIARMNVLARPHCLDVACATREKESDKAIASGSPATVPRRRII